MTLLKSTAPPPLALGRLNRIAVIALPVLGIVLGGWEAKDCAARRFGYAAGYAYAATLFFAIALCVIGLLLLIYWRTRSIGVGLIASGVLSCVAFYGVMGILLRLDRVSWKHEPPPIAIGPDQKATLVVYFKHGTTDEQIENFRYSVLSGAVEPLEYLRLLPDQANGHEAVALTYSNDVHSEQLTRYINTIEHDSRVEKTYRNVAPNAIPPEQERTQ